MLASTNSMPTSKMWRQLEANFVLQEILETFPFRFFRVKHEWILAFFFQSGVETPQVPVTCLLYTSVTEKSKFEVLAAELSKEGKMTYKRVGVIQPKENLLWDNRYMASEQKES